MLQPHVPDLSERIRGGHTVIACCPESGAYIWKSRRQYGLILPIEEKEAKIDGVSAPKHYLRVHNDQDAIVQGNRRLRTILEKRANRSSL